MGSLLASVLMREQPLTKVICEVDVPLPEKLHHVLLEETIGDRQVLVIGDVHGCFDELQDLLSKYAITPENTVLVFCGDIINRGPKNCETLRFIRSLGSAALSVRGNHEDRVIHEWLKIHKLANGCVHTPHPKLKWVKDLKQEDVDYLISLPYTLTIPGHETVVLHAGMDPWRGLLQQQPVDLVLTRNIVDPEGPTHQLSDSLNQGVPWSSCWNGPMHVYFGHDARRGLQERRFATGLDTGCVYGSRLTGALLTKHGNSISRELVSVSARQVYKEKSAKISHEDFFYECQ